MGSRRTVPAGNLGLVSGGVAVNQDKALHLLFRQISPAAGDPADDLVLRLRELRDAKDDLLTDDEYEDCRQTIIAQVVGRVRIPAIYRVTLAVLLAGCIALVCWRLAVRDIGTAIGGLLSGALCLAIWRGLERDYAAKRALPRSSRLAVVERLVHEQLITESEATKFRGQIDASFPADAA
jgi:hypothetical protein